MPGMGQIHAVVCLLAALLISSGENPACAEWKAGISRVKITPTHHMPMGGYGSRGAKHSEGTLTDLWAKILVLQDSTGKQAALITLDLVGIDHHLSTAICETLQKEHKWQRDQIAICTSHTHTGPVVGQLLPTMHYNLFDAPDRQLVDDYSLFLNHSIVGGVRDAVQSLKPAELFSGSGRATFAVNRRENKEAEINAIQQAGTVRGPSDHDVPVLAVRSQGKLSAVVFGYACHNTTLSVMQWSGDYAGFAQLDLEKQFPDCQAMFWSGCGADQNPLPRKTVELAQKYGAQLAGAVRDVIHDGLSPIAGNLQTRYAVVDVPLGTLPTTDVIQADTLSTNHYIVSRAKALLQQLSEGKPLTSSYAYPVEIWKLGNDVTFVFLGGEVVVDYAIRLKDELGARTSPTKVWCAGYANDVMAYIPSRRVLLEGGYEGETSMVYYGLPTSWGPQIEDLIVGKAHELAGSTKK